MTISRTVLTAVIAAGAGVFMSGFATAQNYPVRPVTLIFPFAPGGSADFARIVADRMSEALGQPIVIENKPGAGTTIGARAAANAVADGYTILLATNATLVTSPLVYPKAGYDARKDFAPIGLLGSSSSVLVVHPSFPAHTVSDLIAIAKNSQKSITFGSPGIGTPNHLSAELLASMAGIRLTHVPYRGAAPAVTDLIGGHIQTLFSAIPNVHGHIKGGGLRALAVSSAKRSPMLPEIPTVAESGLAGFDTAVKYYLVAPKHTPRATIDKLNAALRATLSEATVRDELVAAGIEPSVGTFDKFAADVDAEEMKWSPLVKSLGLKAQ
jgi:tripartite-type tricarboxylate transporter receptor subunit TctC